MRREQHPDGHWLVYTDAGRIRGREWEQIDWAYTRDEAESIGREREADLMYWGPSNPGNYSFPIARSRWTKRNP